MGQLHVLFLLHSHFSVLQHGAACLCSCEDPQLYPNDLKIRSAASGCHLEHSPLGRRSFVEILCSQDEHIIKLIYSCFLIFLWFVLTFIN